MSGLREATDFCRARIARTPDVLLVLGSGLGDLADDIEDATYIPFGEVPGFPTATVVGHKGRMVVGRLEGAEVLALQGRFHLYEGHDAALAALPVRIAHALGARTMLVTNAAGGIARRLRAGDLMLIDDHINLMGRNPLIGPVLEGDERFPDMSAPYDRDLQAAAERIALDQGLKLQRGVYAGLLGPAYETPAEVRMLDRLGADAVGMSTVPEVIAARAMGMRVLGISLISNAAAGISGQPLSHDEVIEAGKGARAAFESLIRALLREPLRR